MNEVLYLLAGAVVCVFLVMASVVVAICWMAHGEPDARRDAERDGVPDQEAIIPDFEEEQVKTLSGMETHYAPSYEAHETLPGVLKSGSGRLSGMGCEACPGEE
jgi:hypothetical protein